VASKWLRFIFQLPLMSGLRGVGHVARPAIAAGPPGRQVALLEQLERGAPAGGDVVDLAGQAELGQRRGAVAAARPR
jgi:hypothetical protein